LEGKCVQDRLLGSLYIVVSFSGGKVSTVLTEWLVLSVHLRHRPVHRVDLRILSGALLYGLLGQDGPRTCWCPPHHGVF